MFIRRLGQGTLRKRMKLYLDVHNLGRGSLLLVQHLTTTTTRSSAGIITGPREQCY
jgi:hypothetical protein